MSPQDQIREWLKQGTITREQAQAMLVEATRRNLGRPSGQGGPIGWVLYGIVGIGVTAIATGFFSLVQAHWDSVTPTVKLILYFAMQMGLGLGVLGTARTRGLARETWTTLFFLFVAVGIALIAHLFGHANDIAGLIFLWLLLTLPCLFHARSRLVPHVWLFGFSAGLVIWVTQGQPKTNGLLTSAEGRFMLSAAVAAILGCLGYLRDSALVPGRFGAAARAWTILWAAGLSLWLSTLVGGSILGETLRPYRHFLWVPSAGLGLLGVSLWFYFRGESWGRAFVIAFFAAVYVQGAARLYEYGGYAPATLISGVLFILSAASAAGAAAAFERRRLYDLATVVIACRLVLFYFEMFASYAATGTGLIVSGVVILVVAFIWYNARSRFSGEA